MAKHDGGPAFPYSALEPDPETRQLVGSIYADSHGMSLRDYFAAKALAAMVTNSETLGTAAQLAPIAYRYADAMLKEREK